MRVVGYDPFVGDDRFREAGIERAPTMEDALAAGDFVTLHLPLTDETQGLIGAEAIAKMKDGARLVNAARGALLDEEALADAIRSGKLAGAALDVFSSEPYTGPLLELDEVVVTPHLAASTDEAQDRAGVIVAEQVVAALEGGLVTNAVNIPVVDAADLEMLGPFIPLAAKLGRLAVEFEGARPKRVAVAAYGPLSELRHAAADRRRAERRLPGPGRPGRQLRERAADRRRARDRGRRGALPGLPRLHEPRVEVRTDGIAVSGTTIGPEPRLFLAGAMGFSIDIEIAPNLVSCSTPTCPA